MTRQNIGIGSAANDGTGDTLRAAGQKINENFSELYLMLGTDSNTLSTQISLTGGAIVFEGASADAHETSLVVTDPTGDRTITLPNATGNVVLDTNTVTLTNKTLTNPTIATMTGVTTINSLTVPSGTDTLVARTSTDTLTNKTLTTPTINSPSIGTLINDENGAEIIRLTATGSAVNDITIANAAASGAPSITASGSDTNINLDLAAKGTGAVRTASKLAYSAETLNTASPTVSQTVPLTIFDRGSAIAASLASGTVVGETKKFVNINSGVATVTPSPFANGTSFSIAQNGAVECIWSGSTWHLLGFDSNIAGLITVTQP